MEIVAVIPYRSIRIENESVSDVPAGSPGYYTMQIETVTAEVAGPGLYHLDVALDDKDFFILPLIFFEEENS